MSLDTLIEFINESLVHVSNVRQKTGWTCGPASVRAVVGALKGLSVTEDEAIELSDADSKNGASPSDIVRALKKLNLNATAQKQLTGDEIAQHIDEDHLIILDVDMWGGEHWVVVHGHDEGMFKIMDPSTDKPIIMSPSALDGIRWNDSRQTTRGGIIVSAREKQ